MWYTALRGYLEAASSLRLLCVLSRRSCDVSQCCAGYCHRLRQGLLGSSLEVSPEVMQQNAHRAGHYLQRTDSQGGWTDLYFFQMQEYSEKDYEIFNWWCATAPQAPMQNMTVAAVQTEHGRITYDGTSLKVFESTEEGDRATEVVELGPLGSEETDKELWTRFGIVFD